jgi:hypothetical protein
MNRNGRASGLALGLDMFYTPIVELGLVLLANAHMPIKLWDNVFLTPTYVVNMLPSKAISHDTPVHRLLGTRHD